MSTSAIAKAGLPSHSAHRHRAWIVVRRRAFLVLICLILTLLMPGEGYLGRSRMTLILNQTIETHAFRLAAWEAQAVRQKASDALTRPGAALDAAAQHDLVVAYFEAVGKIGHLNRQIERIYADPKETDPTIAAAPLQAELDSLRDQQARRRPAVERILERQIAAVLNEEGLTTGGHVWPAVRFQFTESPLYLIVSPRDRIVVEEGIYLEPDLALAQTERIETAIATQLDVSALVEGTGGFSSYPTMVIEYPVMEWVLSTIAHEWGHTYLFFRPLGWHYGDSSATRTINETTVSILGDEIAARVLARYYPDQAPPSDWPRPLAMSPDWWNPTPPRFEFGKFMRATRLRVDQLLAAGAVADAEAYMEAQRQVLVEQGYTIRKLNQAYFAFHGSYAVGPSATDPIGGKLRALRHRTGSLAEFMQVVSRITSAADLDAALAQTR